MQAPMYLYNDFYQQLVLKEAEFWGKWGSSSLQSSHPWLLMMKNLV